MYKYFLKALLLSNSTGVMKKYVVQDALKAWSDKHQEILTKNRVPHFLSTEACTLVHMVQCIKNIQRSMTSGKELLSWLREFVNLLDQGFSTEDSSIVLAIENSAEQDSGTIELPSEHNADDEFHVANMSFLKTEN